MKQSLLLALIATLVSVRASAQVQERDLKRIFDQPIETAAVWSSEQLQYALEKVPALPSPSKSAEWTREADNLRKRVLDNVIFHGWPKQMVEAKPVFEDIGTIPSGKGYRMR